MNKKIWDYTLHFVLAVSIIVSILIFVNIYTLLTGTDAEKNSIIKTMYPGYHQHKDLK